MKGGSAAIACQTHIVNFNKLLGLLYMPLKPMPLNSMPMKQLLAHAMTSLPYLLVLGVLLAWPPFQPFVLTNILVQAALFIAVVIIPAIKTNRMAYVDIGWPVGLFLIGVQVLVFSDGDTARASIVAALYMFAGARMGLMALTGWRLGMLNKELPRYQYQRLRWDRRGWHHRPAMLFEVATQGLANMSVLAIPAIVQAANPTAALSALEIAAYLLWVAAFSFEFTADAQKLKFARRMKAEQKSRMHCAEGLWKYCRHPNYFGEWMVWNALCLATIPSLWYFAGSLPIWLMVSIFAGLLYLCFTMYQVLTYYSGAVPSEYYSAQKRPGYAEYQRTTNMFFPGRARR